MRVLFLTHRLPYAPNRGDRVRAFHIIRSLAGRMDVDLVSLVHSADEGAHAARMQERGMRVTALRVPKLRTHAAAVGALAGSRPLTHVLLDARGLNKSLQRIVRERRPDVVLAYCSGMARLALEPPLAEFPLVLDLVDVDSEKWTALAAKASWPKRAVYQREAKHLAHFERRAAMQAHATLVVNEREHDALRQLAPDAAISIIPNGVDVEGLRPSTPPGEAPHVVFCGVMNYGPNVDGVLWFAREVWPIVRAKNPGARFSIVGSDPSAVVRRLADDDAGIEVTGTVPDVRDYLWRSAVSVSPMTTARGVQNKVLEALAAGLPAVVTSQVIEGLPSAIRPGCRIGDDAATFARETLALLELTGSQRRAIAGEADFRGLSWDSRLAPLHDILASAVRERRPKAS